MAHGGERRWRAGLGALALPWAPPLGEAPALGRVPSPAGRAAPLPRPSAEVGFGGLWVSGDRRFGPVVLSGGSPRVLCNQIGRYVVYYELARGGHL